MEKIIEYIRDYFTKYKVAVQFSGQPRSFKTDFETYKKYILEPLSPDLYMHTWNTEETQQMVSMFKPKSFEIEEYNPQKFDMTSYKIKAMGLYPGTDSPNNKLANYYSRYKCNILRQQSNINYDIIIGFRSELTLPRALTRAELKLAKNNILIPSGFDAKGINDIIYFANPKIADIYTSLYPCIQRMIFDQHNQLDPHINLLSKLTETKAPIIRFDYKVKLRDIPTWKL